MQAYYASAGVILITGFSLVSPRIREVLSRIFLDPLKGQFATRFRRLERDDSSLADALTSEQLSAIRDVALSNSQRLKVTDAEAALIADAIVGSLTTSSSTTSVTAAGSTSAATTADSKPRSDISPVTSHFRLIFISVLCLEVALLLVMNGMAILASDPSEAMKNAIATCTSLATAGFGAICGLIGGKAVS